MGRRTGLRQVISLLAALTLLGLTACGNTADDSDTQSAADTSSEVLQNSSSESSETDSAESFDTRSSNAESSSPEQAVSIAKPQFEIADISDSGAVLRLENLPENVDTVCVYRLHTSSDNAGQVTKELLMKTSAEDINDSFEISFGESLDSTVYEKDDSALKCPYYAEGLQVSYLSGEEEISSDIELTKVTLDTGTVNQYNATLAGSTACGAAAGTLVLQSVAPVWGDELTARMDTIRSYSALSDEFSIGGAEYYMSGQQISNSVNKYISDNSLGEYHLTDFRGEMSTEDTLTGLISTGRPAVLEVCYIGGNIVTEFQGYSHWITINGFRRMAGGVEFRCEDTISLAQRWITSSDLDAANANVQYGGDLVPTRYISSFENAVIDNFM